MHNVTTTTKATTTTIAIGPRGRKENWQPFHWRTPNKERKKSIGTSFRFRRTESFLSHSLAQNSQFSLTFSVPNSRIGNNHMEFITYICDLTFSASIECTFDFVHNSHWSAKPFFPKPIYLRQSFIHLYARTHTHTHTRMAQMWKILPPSLSDGSSRKTHIRFLVRVPSLFPVRYGNSYTRNVAHRIRRFSISLFAFDVFNYSHEGRNEKNTFSYYTCVVLRISLTAQQWMAPLCVSFWQFWRAHKSSVHADACGGCMGACVCVWHIETSTEFALACDGSAADRVVKIKWNSVIWYSGFIECASTEIAAYERIARILFGVSAMLLCSVAKHKNGFIQSDFVLSSKNIYFSNWILAHANI